MTKPTLTLVGSDGARLMITERTSTLGRSVTVIEYRNGLSPFGYVSAFNPYLAVTRDQDRGLELWVDGFFVALPEASAAEAAEYLGISIA
jgi:hypothetical protein